MAPNYIRMSEVENHTSSSSVWFVIQDAVYDVTSFLDQHPGGADALLENAGQDATVAFEDVGHSEGARLDLKKYKIGDLHPDDCINKNRSRRQSRPRVRIVTPAEEQRSGLIKLAAATVVIGIVIGFALKRYRVI